MPWQFGGKGKEGSKGRKIRVPRKRENQTATSHANPTLHPKEQQPVETLHFSVSGTGASELSKTTSQTFRLSPHRISGTGRVISKQP